MMPPTLTESRVSFITSLGLSGRSPGTLALYERSLKELEDWLADNGKPLTVDEIESRQGLLAGLGGRGKRPGHADRGKAEGGLASDTKRSYCRVLSSFFGRCERGPC